MSENDLLDDSDSSDEDYVPKNEELPSENESEGDNEDPISDSEELGTKRKRHSSNKSSRKRKSKINGEEKDANNEHEVSSTSSKGTVEDKKKKDDDLWADFMKDTGFKSRTSSDNLTTKTENMTANTSQCKQQSSKNSLDPTKDKVKITQIFEFAGEEVKVEKEVDTNSAEARLLAKDVPRTSSSKRGGLSGIGNVLSQLGKKQKISTLEKSKLDWDKFKKEEQIEEELTTHNKGKDGYLDRQDFLQRADLRRFEIEKDIRNVERSKRFNTTL